MASVDDLWQAALESAEDARPLFDRGRYRGAASRAYYAMFSAARALLLARGVANADAKRHATVWSEFSLRFVKGGPFERGEGAAFVRVGEVRNVADYGGVPVNKDTAEFVMGSMERFLKTADIVLRKESSSKRETSQ